MRPTRLRLTRSRKAYRLTAPAPLLLIVGMHRSGTSLLGGLLQRLGVALPGEQIAADHHNPEGYFESREVVDLQERLLIDLDRWWPSANGCLALPPNWLQHPATLATRVQLRELLRAERCRQQGPWAIKDPRTSRLLPLWLDLAAELGIPLRLLLAVRDPAEVARSLIQRDGPITGMDLARAQQLWWLHNLEPLQAAPPQLPQAVLDFGAWFTQPERQLDGLLELIPELQPNLEQRCAALSLICPELRRSLETASALSLDRRVRCLHRQLLAGRRRWPAAQPPRSLRSCAEFHPAPRQLAADPSCWSHWLEVWRHHPAPRHPGVASVAPQAVISLCGITHHNWSTHLWIQRLPLKGFAASAHLVDPSDPHNLPLAGTAAAGLTRLALNFELPPTERAKHWLMHLQGQQLIWDPEPARVLLLRELGLPAYWLDPDAPDNGWLQQRAAADPGHWAALLGLPPPPSEAVLVLGSAGPEWDRALAAESAQAAPAAPPIAYLPGWPELISADAASALAQAGWLVAAASTASALVWCGAAPPCHALPVSQLVVQPPFTPAELRAELAGQPLQALAEDRPAPPLEELFSWELSGEQQLQPAAAVLVSLFNYGDRVADALESVAVQQEQGLELIVVDDASSDQGAAVVQGWMQAQLDGGAHPFARLQLLRHRHNAGLSTARNTAFAAARAPWCFVLDADNFLFPDAVAACLRLALAGSPELAVVHPLLAVEVEPGRPDDQRTLVRPQSWQRQRFRFENNVDAMALVRRSAWQAVGGYTHIEGGWEDYDFWCKLTGAGYHGLQCPQFLAVYRSHAKSMSHTSTNRNWRALARTLQARHPWLQLPLARGVEVL